MATAVRLRSGSIWCGMEELSEGCWRKLVRRYAVVVVVVFFSLLLILQQFSFFNSDESN